MTELIVKGTFIGIGLFSLARMIYYMGFRAGATALFNELTKRNETASQTRNVARKD